MLTLYVKTGCRYCALVLSTITELGLIPTIKNVADPGVYDELEKLGGKKQEPFLVDSEKNVALYESTNIINHLEKYYGSGRTVTAEKGTPGICELPI